MIQEKLLTGPSLASAAGARPTMDPACLRCCRGLYSCHWRQNERGNRRQRCACCWLSFIFLVSLLALIWIYFWVIAYNDRDDVNWKAFTILRRWINWFMVMVIISAVLAIYSCLLLLFALFQIALREPLDLHWLHKVLLLLAVVIITVGIAGIIMAWKREWDAVYLSLQATGPFLQIGGVVALTLLSWFVFQKVFMSRNAVSRAVTLLLFVLVSIIIFVCPCFIKSPCLLERLPSKPALIGHRGAPMMAPENTIMSFRKSIDCGLLAFETDVQLSKDGVPFLMHDCNDTFLQRTTNVKEVFKDQEYNAAPKSPGRNCRS
ncbi:hypothetical protein GJAV_G00200970 [Gymnothorax javanicus]|nr:hypothetical protein GJAV_G00200970 [Gymnothorax javanicus]